MRSFLGLSSRVMLLLVVTLEIGRAAPSLGAETKPVPDALTSRVWTDATGRFSTRATFVGGDRSCARLRKLNGVEIAIAMERLSDVDRRIARELLKSHKDGPAGVAGSPVLHTVAKAITSLAVKLPESITGTEIPAILDATTAGARPFLAPASQDVPKNMIYVRLSRQFLEKTAARNVDRQTPVVDVVLGAQVCGTSHTVGRVDYQLQPNDRAGVAALRFTGSTAFDSVAYAGPVRVFTSGVTRFESTKPIWMDAAGMHSSPAVTTARTHSTITGVDSTLPGLRGRIATRIGSRKSAESLAQAESITADHTRIAIERDFNRETDQQLAGIWKSVSDQIATLPLDRTMGTAQLKVSSTRDAIEVVVLGAANAPEIGAAPSSLKEGAAVEAYVHAGLLTKFMAGAASLNNLPPAAAQIASAPGAPPLQPRQMRWSADGQWLAISWQAGGETIEQIGKPAAIVARRN